MIHGETFGAVLAVVASIVSNLGINIQKYSHANQIRKLTQHQKPYYRCPVWIIGFLFVVIGNLGDFTAFGFANQSLVVALGGGSTLLANIFTAHLLNKEPLHLADVIGITFVIFGIIIIALLAEPDQKYTLAQLEDRFVRTEFIAYSTFVSIVIVGILANIKGSMAYRLRSHFYATQQRQKTIIKVFFARLRNLEHRLVTLEKLMTQSNVESTIRKHSFLGCEEMHFETPQVEVEPIVPYYYAICSGMIGAFSVLLAKCTALLLVRTISGDNQFKHALTYIFIGGMAISILIQTHLFNMAALLGDIMTVFPVFQACWIICSVLHGAIFYRQKNFIPIHEWIWYPTALLSIIIGVGFLILKKFDSRRNEEFSADKVCLITDISRSSPLLSHNVCENEGYVPL